MSEAMVEVLQPCALCGIGCINSCPFCNKVRYCTKAHRKQDWKKHKSDCFPAKIGKTEDSFGRFVLIATREIKQGEVIFKEDALFSGPQVSRNSLPLCISCSHKLQQDYEKCSFCKFPICGLSCEMNAVHAEQECKIFAANNINYDANCQELIYHSIGILRGLLFKDKNPIKWNSLLEFHELDDKDKVQDSSSSTEILDFIQKSCGLKDRFEDNDILQVEKLLKLRSLQKGNGNHLYFNASLLFHNCIPNCSWTIQSDNQFLIRASIPIKSDEILSIQYINAQSDIPFELQVTSTRYQILQEKDISCACKRCFDLTEIETFICGIKCTRCTEGYAVPTNPIKLQESQWKCYNIQCLNILQDSYVENILTKIRILHNEAVMSNDSLSNETEIIEKLEKIIEENSQITVHRNHFLMLKIENDILHRISCLFTTQLPLALSVETLEQYAKRLVELSNKGLVIGDKLFPGYNTLRGPLLYFLQHGWAILLIIKISKSMHMTEEDVDNSDCDEGKEDFQKSFDELLQLRKNIFKILAYEPENSNGQNLLKLLLKDSIEIKVLKKYFDLSIN